MNYFLLGLGIGLTVAVVLTPKSGDETREFLSNKASEGTDYLAQQTQTLKDSASELVEKGRNILADQKDKLASATQAASEAYRRAS